MRPQVSSLQSKDQVSHPFNGTLWFSDWLFCFLFRTLPFQTSVQNLTILFDIFVFSSFPYKCTGITLHWAKTLSFHIAYIHYPFTSLLKGIKSHVSNTKFHSIKKAIFKARYNFLSLYNLILLRFQVPCISNLLVMLCLNMLTVTIFCLQALMRKEQIRKSYETL